MPFCIAVPKVSLTCMNTTVFGAEPGRLEDLLLVGEGVGEDHAGAVGKLRNTNL